MQQIIVSGVGGQGVLFVTKLLAETALSLDLPVLISETHGMAQRGGNVISHLKVGNHRHAAPGGDPEVRSQAPGYHFTSPLIRPGRADILLALHPDAIVAHGFYLREDGKTFCNNALEESPTFLDASQLARNLGAPICANLILLGFAVASGSFFCRPGQLEEVLRRYGGKRLEINLNAFHAGLSEAGKRGWDVS